MEITGSRNLGNHSDDWFSRPGIFGGLTKTDGWQRSAAHSSDTDGWQGVAAQGRDKGENLVTFNLFIIYYIDNYFSLEKHQESLNFNEKKSVCTQKYIFG